MRDSDSSKLRPIDAFVKYFLDVKPYHTKLLEVVERYKFAETMTVDITDTMFADIAYRNNPLCKAVGFGLIFDQCGFSNDNCCDLFQCLGGYGLIWDNSDIVADYAIRSVNTETDEFTVLGDHTRDTRLEIISISGNRMVLRGNVAGYFDDQKLFLIAPFNVYSITSLSDNVIVIPGNVADELNIKRSLRISNDLWNNGVYGVNVATYDPLNDQTRVEVAGDVTFIADSLAGAYIETESQPKNQGFYSVNSAYTEDGNTTVIINDTFPVASTVNNGCVQLRDGLTAPRRVWLTDNNNLLREYRIADSYFLPETNETRVVLAEQYFTADTYNEASYYTEARLYGYMTNAGFDNDEECDVPKPTNVHALFGERLVINIMPIVSPTPTPTVTPTISAPAFTYSEYFYYESYLTTTPYTVHLGYGRVTDNGVQELAYKEKTAPYTALFKGGQSALLDGVIYKTFGNGLGVYKYANNTLEEVQVISLTDLTPYVVAGYTMNSATFSGLALDATNRRIYVAVDLSYNIGYASRTIIKTGTIDVNGMITMDGETQILDTFASGLYYQHFSSLYLVDNLLVCTINQWNSADTSRNSYSARQSQHRLYSVTTAGAMTFIASTFANGGQYYAPADFPHPVRGHNYVIFDAAPNRIWAYPFTSSGWGTSFQSVLNSSIGDILYGGNLYDLPSGDIRIAGAYNVPSFTVASLDFNLTTGFSSQSFISAYNTDGRSLQALSNFAKIDLAQNKAIVFDVSGSIASNPTTYTAMTIDFNPTGTNPSYAYGISTHDNILPFSSGNADIHLLSTTLPVFAITPTPTPTMTVTPTPTRTVTPTPTPSRSVGAPTDWLTPTQVGLAGSSGLSTVVGPSASVDDSSYKLTLPFAFNFFGNDYGNDNNGGVYVGTNSYVTFGFGSNAYNVTPTTPGHGVMVRATDNRIEALYAGSENGGESFRVRYEGNNFSGTTNIVWEMTFYASHNYIQLVTGALPVSGSTINGITDGTAMLPSYTFAANTSYVLASAPDGTGWTISEGSVYVSATPPPTPSITVTPTPTPTPSPSYVFTATVMDTTTADPTITFSGGNLTVTETGGVGNANARATASKSTGKVYWEAVMASVNSSGWFDIGMVQSSDSIHTPNYISQNGNGFVVEGGIGYGDLEPHSSSGWGSFTPEPDPAVGDVVQLAVDLDNKLFWIKYTTDSVWNGGAGDPASGTGGYSFTGTAPFTPAVDLKLWGLTLRFTSASMTGTIPTGFTAWDG